MKITHFCDRCSVKDNPVTLVFVLLILCVYFLLLVLAVRLDRRDAVRSAPIEVVDSSSVSGDGA